MKFTNEPLDGGSYEKPKPGKYIGVLVGFAYVGTQPGGQFAARPKVALRWELHKRRGPSVDSQGNIHTIVNSYSATIRGENSTLRKVLEAHGITIPEGGSTDSRDWLGHAAWLDLEESKDSRWVNVASVSRLDPDDDPQPTNTLHLEEWEPDCGKAPPSWCNWLVARSSDLAHLATKKPAAAAVAAPATADDFDATIPF